VPAHSRGLAHCDRTVGPLEQVRLELPDGGAVDALRLQDLPAEHVLAFMAMPPGMKEIMGVRLFQLALGSDSENVLDGMTFGELQVLYQDWMTQSLETEDSKGLDWTPPWV
jgi:hypothetical protein